MAGQYDFDQVVDRRGTSCIKYDFGMKRMGRDDLLPLWVADMDFRLPQEILDDLHARIEHGIFGYTDPTDEYYQALDRWFFDHHNYHVQPEWVTVGCGVVFALAVAVRAFSKPGDAILIQQPVYYPFKEVIETNERICVNCQLQHDNGSWNIDFEAFERSIIEHNVKVFILCNPHNPVGRVWLKEELERLADICMKHNVVILSDEIHCDFVWKGHTFVSMLTLDQHYKDNLVVFTSPSKTFNIAGLQPANILIPHEGLRAKYRASNDASGYSQGNVMGMSALVSCYTKGDSWVKEMKAYIEGNIAYAQEFFKTELPQACVTDIQGTYLLWVDFSAYGLSVEELDDLVVDKAHLWLDSGAIFGEATAHFQRFNLACPRSILEQALTQLRDAFANR